MVLYMCTVVVVRMPFGWQLKTVVHMVHIVHKWETRLNAF